MYKREYQICNRCVLDTSDPEITFDGQGNCNHCNSYFEKIKYLSYQGKKSDNELAALVSEIKAVGKNNDYDCLIGLSGGIDSSYVAYIVKKLGLRPLAWHLDNGWNSDQAVKNIKSICSKLDIDYVSHVLDWEEFKDIQLSVLKSGITELEIPTDVAILGAAHKIASKNKIKYIISGGNFATEGLLPDKWFYNPKDEKLLRAIQKQFGTKPIKTFPFFNYKKEIYYKFFKGIKMKYILNLVPFSKEIAMKTLESELDWQYYGGKHYESKYTGFVQSFIQPVKFNVDYRRATFSTQICAGTTTREEALKDLVNPPHNNEKIDLEMEYVAKKLGVTLKQFKDIMNAPPISYKNYPNDEKKLNFIYKVYNRFFSIPRN